MKKPTFFTRRRKSPAKANTWKEIKKAKFGSNLARTDAPVSRDIGKSLHGQGSASEKTSRAALQKVSRLMRTGIKRRMPRIKRPDLSESTLLLHPVLHGRTHRPVAKALDIHRRQLGRASARKTKWLGHRSQRLIDKLLKRLSTVFS